MIKKLKQFIKQVLKAITPFVNFFLVSSYLFFAFSYFGIIVDEKNTAYADNADDIALLNYSQISGIIAITPNGRFILENSSNYSYNRIIVSDYESPILYFRSPVLMLETGVNEFVISCPSTIYSIFISYTAVDLEGNTFSDFTTYYSAMDLDVFSYVERDINTDFYLLTSLVVQYDVNAVGNYPFAFTYYNGSEYSYGDYTLICSEYMQTFFSDLEDIYYNDGYNEGYAQGLDAYPYNNPFKAITDFFQRMIDIPLIGWLTIGDLVLVAIMIPLTILICKFYFGG